MFFNLENYYIGQLTSSLPQELTLHVLLPVCIPVFVDHVCDSDSPFAILGVLPVVGDDWPLVSGVKLLRAFWTVSMYDRGSDSSGLSGRGWSGSTLLWANPRLQANEINVISKCREKLHFQLFTHALCKSKWESNLQQSQRKTKQSVFLYCI